MNSSAKSNIPEQKTDNLYVLGILIMALGLTFSTYGTSIVLPDMLAKLNASSHLSMITAMGTMGMMLGLPVVGKLGELIGRKTLTYIGMALQFVARVALIFVTNLPLFIIFFVLSSVGTSLFISASYTFMATAVTPKDRPKYYGYIATCNAVGGLIGPLLTGWLVDSVSAYIAFLSYAPLTLIAFFILLRKAPNARGAKKNEKFDFAGVLLSVFAICSLVLWLGLSGVIFAWTSIPSIAMAVFGVAGMILLIKRETTIANPAVPVLVFKHKRFTASFIVAAIMAMYSTCAATYGIVYVRMALQGGTATLSGTVTMPQTIAVALGGLFFGRYLSKNFTKRFRLLGILAPVSALIATLILFALKPTSSIVQIWIATGLGGVGSGICQSSLSAFFQTELKPEEIPAGQAMYSFGSTGGSTIFGALAAVILNAGAIFNDVFLLGAGFCVIAVIVAVIFFRFTKEEIETAETRE